MGNDVKTSLVDKPVKVSNSLAGLPPIKQLFSDAWKTLTLSLLNLFLLTLVNIAANATVFLIFGLLMIIIAVMSGLGKNLIQQPSGLANLPIFLLIFVMVLGIVFGVFFILMNYVLRIASVIVVARSENNVGLKESIKLSLKRVLPLIATDFIVSFFMIGGSLLLIFPALIFYFFFIFVNFEVILNNQSFLNALKRSVLLVSRRFGELLIRILMLGGIYILLTIILPSLLRRIDPEAYWLIAIWSILPNMLLGWYSLAYTLELYKQSQEGLENEKLPSLSVFWIVAILGWIFAVMLLILGIKIASLPSTQKFFQEKFVPTPTIYMRRKLPPFYVPTLSPTTESPFL